MTRIDKYSLDRMKRKGVALSFRCPYCEGARLEMKTAQDLDPLEGIRCYKCKAQIVLDSLSLTVIRERPRPPVKVPHPKTQTTEA